MRTDVQSRGFTLTTALRAAVSQEARDFAARFPKLPTVLQVRLFDVNGPRGGADKGCLVHARVGKGARVVVATEIDSDLYRAIAAAFVKLERSTEAALGRRQSARYRDSGRSLYQ